MSCVMEVTETASFTIIVIRAMYACALSVLVCSCVLHNQTPKK